MPKSIGLGVSEAEAEMEELSMLIIACKDDNAMRNRYTARRSRLARHVVMHSNADKTVKQSTTIVHLRSQVHMLRGMLMQMGVNVPDMDAKGGAWLGHGVWAGDVSSVKPIDSTGSAVCGVGVRSAAVVDADAMRGGGMECLDELIGSEVDDGRANDIETLMREDSEYGGCETMYDMFSGSL
jgi:hypothetical protein